MTAIPLVIFVFFSGLWANLFLQCGLGLKGFAASFNDACAQDEQRIDTTLAKLGIIFLTVLLLWSIFDKILFFLTTDLMLYVLVFPAGAMAYSGMEYLFYRFALKKETEKGGHVDFCSGITAAALFVCLNIANNFLEAAAISFGTVSGILLSVIILREIRRRASLEAVPLFLRGKPLLLISMGLLSLVYYAASSMFFRVFGG